MLCRQICICIYVYIYIHIYEYVYIDRYVYAYTCIYVDKHPECVVNRESLHSLPHDRSVITMPFLIIFRASQSTNVPARIYAIEKNLHAVITLRNRAVAEEWGDDVQIIGKVFT
jgi:hypothetical protein